jgi:hypothetical protein
MTAVRIRPASPALKPNLPMHVIPLEQIRQLLRVRLCLFRETSTGHHARFLAERGRCARGAGNPAPLATSCRTSVPVRLVLAFAYSVSVSVSVAS